MNSLATLEKEITAFLKPISEINPSGESLRYTLIYDHIREARREEDKNLPRGIWHAQIKKANWEEVISLCQSALKTKTKDIQIAAWLTEAWVHCDGISGLIKGIDLIKGLTQIYWKDVYPQIESESYESRFVPYEWLNTTLVSAINLMQINLPVDRSAPRYTFLDFKEAKQSSLNSKAVSAQNKQGEEKSIIKISQSLDKTPSAFYRHIKKSCDQSLESLNDLEKLLSDYVETGAPTFSLLKEKIQSIHQFGSQILLVREKKASQQTTEGRAMQIVNPIKDDSIVLESRDQTYALLKEIADYLNKTEPHSLSPYLIRRAIHWGKMDLSGVMTDILQNGGDISLLFNVLGIPRSQ